MPLRKLQVIVLALLSLSYVLGAQETAGTALSLGQCLDLAFKQNPLLLSSLEKYRASRARISQALAIPQPSLEFDSDLQPRPFHFRGSGESYLGISQTVEFPGKSSLRGKIASRESDELRAEIDLLRLDLEFQVKQAFYGLLAAQERTSYAQQDHDLSRDFLQKAEIMRTSGDIAEVEVLRARVEASRTANALKVAENNTRLAAAALNFLLARKKYEPLEILGEMRGPFIPLDIEALKLRALALRPELRGNKAAVEKESLRKTAAFFSYLPDFDLGLSRHRIAGELKTWDFTVSLPIPLFFWQPAKGLAAEADANREALKRESEHLANAIALEVEEAYMNALAASDQIKLFEEQVLTQAEEVYEIFLFKFQEGEIGGIELIDARRSLNEARGSYADALFNYRVTIAALEKSIGQSLDGEDNDQD
ncbi:MAG: TolC family protein [Candidatus Aminicenantes bacterium]|nr:MAG: TolC family protein [Candidatus Aminicenantes bacterium]